MIIQHIVHDGRGYTAMTPQKLLAVGVPQAVIDSAVSDARRNDIKAECKRRIYAVASPETQMNMATSAALVSAKTATNRSTGEADILTNVGIAVGWVDAMKTAIVTLAADDEIDFKADASWPALPDEVTALVDLF